MDKEYTREVHVEIGGEKHRVLLNLWGLVLAEEKGFDVQEIEIDEEEAQKREGNLKQMLDLLWIGMLPFNEDLEKKDLGMQVGFDDMPAITEAFQKVMSRQMTDEIEEKIEGGDSGKGQSPEKSSDS